LSEGVQLVIFLWTLFSFQHNSRDYWKNRLGRSEKDFLQLKCSINLSYWQIEALSLVPFIPSQSEGQDQCEKVTRKAIGSI
jgi:hypothetical protein